MALQPAKSSITQWLHSFAPLRMLARRALAGHTIEQRFHGGVICLDAVEHSWAWTGRLRYESFDAPLQTLLASHARASDVFIDVGCNLGAMTLAVLLRTPNIRAIAIDPNARAVSLLERSLARNRLTSRATVIAAAASTEEGTLTFDEAGSVTGHVSTAGRKVRCVDLPRLVQAELQHGHCLVKIDVEGYETALLPQLCELDGLHRLTLVVEVHPRGFNGAGNPMLALAALRGSNATITTIDGATVESLEEEAIHQVVARWPEAREA